MIFYEQLLPLNNFKGMYIPKYICLWFTQSNHIKTLQPHSYSRTYLLCYRTIVMFNILKEKKKYLLTAENNCNI